jgi:hypothetical protein
MTYINKFESLAVEEIRDQETVGKEGEIQENTPTTNEHEA